LKKIKCKISVKFDTKQVKRKIFQFFWEETLFWRKESFNARNRK